MFLPPDAEVVDVAFDIQRRLFEVGMGRGVGVSDLQIAATAIRHSTDQRSVTVVHYDADFDLVARVRTDLRARWIVPRGTVD